MNDFSDAMIGVDALGAHAQYVVKVPVEEADIPDVVGKLASIERLLRNHRLGLLSEDPEQLEGFEYRLVPSRTAKRSYSTARLVGAFMEADDTDDFGRTVARLMHAGVIRLTWQWTNLKRALHERDIPLLVEQREIPDDGDSGPGPLVGETWRTSYTVEPQKKGEVIQ